MLASLGTKDLRRKGDNRDHIALGIDACNRIIELEYAQETPDEGMLNLQKDILQDFGAVQDFIAHAENRGEAI